MEETEEIKQTEPEEKPEKKKRLAWLMEPKVMFPLLGLILLLIVIPILAIILGFDQQIIKSTLEGYVRNEQGQGLESAIVKIQGKEATTDRDGHYLIGDLLYGTYDAEVITNGYGSVNEKVKLQRFGNIADFTVKKQEFGEIEFTLDLQGKPFSSSEFMVSINDEQLNYDKDFKIFTGRLLTGKYILKIETPFYVDIKTEVEVISGLSKEKILLVPAADVVGEVKNWLTGEELKQEKVEIERSGVFVPLETDNIEENRINIKNLEVDSNLKLKISVQGFNTLEKEIKTAQGLNSLGELELVPAGKIMTLKDDGFNRQVYVSDLNGRKAKNIVNTTLNCSEIMHSLSQGFVKCGAGTIYQIGFTGEGAITGTVSVSGNLVNYNYWTVELFVVDNTQTDKLKRIGGGAETVLYSGDNAITSIVSDRAGNAVFTTDSEVYIAGENADTLKKLSDGQFLASDVSPDGNKTLLLNLTSSNNNIWVIDNNSLAKSKLTFLPGIHSNVHFINDSEFVYIAERNSVRNLFLQNIGSTVARQLKANIDYVRPVIDTDILYLISSSKNYLMKVQSERLAPIEL